MAKLFFRYSAMDAGKTLDLLKVAYNYLDRDLHILILTSVTDTRAGKNLVKSRVGFNKEAISTTLEDDLFTLVKTENAVRTVSCVLVDEIHFFAIKQIEQISDIVDYLNIPVICYGLRTDYCGRPFATASYLLSIADTLEELKTICHCGRKATFNMLVQNDQVIKQGAVIVVDNDDLHDKNIKFISVCRNCWKENKYTSDKATIGDLTCASTRSI